MGNAPPIGVAGWLLSTDTLLQRIEWIVRNNFDGFSLLQSFMNADKQEKEEAAAAIKEHKLYLSYHGNVHHNLSPAGELDLDFCKQVLEDVLWWHAHTDGVWSCCFDSINNNGSDDKPAFSPELNRQYMQMMAEAFNDTGIRFGIENLWFIERLSTISRMQEFKSLCAGIEFGMLLDAGHANIHVRSDGVEGETVMEPYIVAIPFDIHEVHFSDNHGERDEHKPLGAGNADLEGLFRGLKQKGFKGVFTLEICEDILNGKYGLDITDQTQMDILLKSREVIKKAWENAV